MRSALILSIFAVLSVPAVAQTAAAPAAAASAGAASAGAAAVGIAPGGGVTEAGGKAAMARVEQHITQLHDRLGITPAQQPKWDAFAAIMRENAVRMERSYADRASRFATLSAVDDMKSYAAVSHAHAENVDRLLPPFESLYAAMTPEQRIAADKTFHNFQRSPEAGKGRRHS